MRCVAEDRSAAAAVDWEAAILKSAVDFTPRIAIRDVRRAFGNRIPTGPVRIGDAVIAIITGAHGERRFRCPGCGRDCFHLHLPRLVCRDCAGCRHLSWHRSAIADAYRVQRWMRRLPRNRSRLKSRLEIKIAELQAKGLLRVAEFLERTERGT